LKFKTAAEIRVLEYGETGNVVIKELTAFKVNKHHVHIAIYLSWDRGMIAVIVFVAYLMTPATVRILHSVEQ
jgi:hypothetical protein